MRIKIFIDDIIDIENVDFNEIKSAQSRHLCKTTDAEGNSVLRMKKRKAMENSEESTNNKANTNGYNNSYAKANTNGYNNSYAKAKSNNSEIPNSIDVSNAKKMLESFSKKDLHIYFRDEVLSKGLLESLKDMLAKEKGDSQVYFHVDSGEEKDIIIRAGNEFKVQESGKIIDSLSKIPSIRQVYYKHC